MWGVIEKFLKKYGEYREENGCTCDNCGREIFTYPEKRLCADCESRMPVFLHRCPKCGSAILKRKSKRGYAYYACERGAECGFMTWDVPTDQDCPVCGQTMFKRSGRGAMKPFCINPECENFLPEDKRGYRRRKTDDAAVSAEDGAPAAEEKPAAQPETKKSAAKKTTAAKKPAAAKKTTAAKKPAAAKKTTTKKTTTKKAEE